MNFDFNEAFDCYIGLNALARLWDIEAKKDIHGEPFEEISIKLKGGRVEIEKGEVKYWLDTGGAAIYPYLISEAFIGFAKMGGVPDEKM